MNYYYAVGGQQNGPVPEEQLDQLVTSGSLSPETLVWKEGMANWEAYSTIKPGAAGSASAPPIAVSSLPIANGVVCTVCRGIFPPDQVIRYGEQYVCGTCKPRFVQGLREGTIFAADALSYASFGKRFLAKILDFLIGNVIGILVGLGGAAILPRTLSAYFSLNLLSFIIGVGYPVFFNGRWGQTLGKMAMRIKIVTPEGSPIGYMRALGRLFAEILSGCLIAVGYLMVLWEPERRALHDRIAGTRVINVA